MNQILESDKDVHAIFLDYKKAFHSVPHTPLINKLQDASLHINLLAWLTDYLTQRKQQIAIDGVKSDVVVVTSGVSFRSFVISIYIVDQ